MKTIYILLTRSGTLLSKLVYSVTGANYTHASLAFDEDLSCLYSSTRKNGYTMFPAGPSREYLDRGADELGAEIVPAALPADVHGAQHQPQYIKTVQLPMGHHVVGPAAGPDVSLLRHLQGVEGTGHLRAQIGRAHV